jgi:hypothetical protein
LGAENRGHDEGVRQFLDIGSGIPTVGNVHEIAQREDPACRVVYVDRDPIGLLFLLVLHWVPDDADPPALVARYREVLAPGSHLAITHMSDDLQSEKITAVAGIVRSNRGDGQVFPRNRSEIAELFGDFELVPPGLAPTGT